jgi:hypothetical protein
MNKSTKNYALLAAIGKSNFYNTVTAATAKFAAIHNMGIPVAKKVSNVDSALAAIDKIAGVSLDIKKMAKCLLSEGDSGKTANCYPTGKDLDKQFLTFVPMAAVVPIRNRNNHDYRLGVPVIMMNGIEGSNEKMYGMDATGQIHCKPNELPRLRKSLRPATMSEIRWICDQLFDGTSSGRCY